MSTDDPGIDVTAVDHIYVSVSDMGQAQTFYDPVMQLLGFKKGTKPIADQPHVHYFNRVTQYTLRPSQGGPLCDPYQPRALHHLCWRVADRAAVDAVHRGLTGLGVAATPPRLYPEYRPDYYATFFEDPDGTRLEVVCDTDLRRVLRQRWHELDGFVDPVSRLPPAAPQPAAGNLRAAIPDSLPRELVTQLACGAGTRIERIVSRGHASPPDFWYDQPQHELVTLVDGAARLEIDGRAPVTLGPGDWLMLEAHLRHRVAWTPSDRNTIWLAVFYGP